MIQQNLFGYVKETCPECKTGEFILQGEYTKFDGTKKVNAKFFKCDKCGFIDKRCS